MSSKLLADLVSEYLAKPEFKVFYIGDGEENAKLLRRDQLRDVVLRAISGYDGTESEFWDRHKWPD